MRPWVARILLWLVSLFLACVIWVAVSAPRRERVSERAFAAPLSFIGMPQNLIITTPESVPDTVNLRLRGRPSDLRALSSKNLEVTVELSWAQAGEATITLRPQLINVPPDVEVLTMDPKQVRFRIEQLRQRAVPIRPFLAGDVPADYVVGTPTADPERALVSGPASQIRNLTEVATERIIMTGRTETFVQPAAVVSDSPLVRVVAPLMTNVTVPVLAEVGPEPEPEAPQTKKKPQ